MKDLIRRVTYAASKFMLANLIVMSIAVTGTSCDSDIPDCPSKMCTLAGGWRLVEIRVNGVTDTSIDITKYRLTLYMPSPTTATTSSFDRINPSGRQDNGVWELTDNNTVLTLRPQQSGLENYVIDHLTPREMILITSIDENKTGRDEYEFVLEAF